MSKKPGTWDIDFDSKERFLKWLFNPGCNKIDISISREYPWKGNFNLGSILQPIKEDTFEQHVQNSKKGKGSSNFQPYLRLWMHSYFGGVRK